MWCSSVRRPSAGERGTAYKDLLDVGLGSSRLAANCGSIDRRIPPAEYRQSLLANNALQNSFALQALMFLHRQKCHAHGIGAGLRQFETQLAALAHKEPVRDLEENAGAIAGFGIASAGAAVREVEQHLDSLAYDVVALDAADAGHESDPAGIVLLRRMVETLGGRGPIRFFSTRRHGHVGSIRMVAGCLAASGSVVLELGVGTSPQRLRGCRALRLRNTPLYILTYRQTSRKVQFRISMQRMQISEFRGSTASSV